MIVKPIIAVLFCFASSLTAQVTVTLNVATRPNTYLSEWASRRETVIFTLTVPTGQPGFAAKFLVEIKKDGVLQARTKTAEMLVVNIPTGTSVYYAEQLIPFRAVEFFGDADKIAAKTGMLPSGDYELCIDLRDPEDMRSLLPQPQCRSFFLTTYQAPALLSPDNDATVGESVRPLFRWTPVTPPYPGLVRYRLMVFEVLEGQRPPQAFRVNQPILDREIVGMTQLIWPADFQLPGRVRKYVWTVRALDEKGNPIGENDGYAPPATFIIGEHDASAELTFFVEPVGVIIAPTSAERQTPKTDFGTRQQLDSDNGTSVNSAERQTPKTDFGTRQQSDSDNGTSVNSAERQTPKTDFGTRMRDDGVFWGPCLSSSQATNVSALLTDPQGKRYPVSFAMPEKIYVLIPSVTTSGKSGPSNIEVVNPVGLVPEVGDEVLVVFEHEASLEKRLLDELRSLRSKSTHELTHVVQQGKPRPPTGSPLSGPPRIFILLPTSGAPSGSDDSLFLVEGELGEFTGSMVHDGTSGSMTLMGNVRICSREQHPDFPWHPGSTRGVGGNSSITCDEFTMVIRETVGGVKQTMQQQVRTGGSSNPSDELQRRFGDPHVTGKDGKKVWTFDIVLDGRSGSDYTVTKTKHDTVKNSISNIR